ncbi:uncharacterized protein LOC100575630 [Acyrthosiphon pisum]|uniref:CHK kinase-like domain-containing protein n=1 Tax=Acyrthosiphon pisum TaxID=7029 RepID=A0A8R2A662_ACYPI|nr:uncharacterized protein LOC100575630 [Acyrthosiphon pisum]|eukprot:XP_003243924.1 PREDICTED: uncharacterized protein LOC100575630 [Acyrthosiphon pisum]
MELNIEKELKTIVSEVDFGKNCKLVSLKLYNCMTGEEEWCYQKIFCDVTTSDGSHHNIIIKLKLQDFVLRKFFESDLLFNNELIFYEKIIPFLLECRGPTVNDANALFVPRFFYGRNKCDELMSHDLIVIENVSTLGYCLSNEKVFLDFDHLKTTLRTIAKFHGLSYTAKHKDYGRFQDIITGIKESQYNGRFIVQTGLLKVFGQRGINRLLERDGDRYRDHAHIRRLYEFFDDAENTLLQKLKSHGPLSVICHFDCHRDTLMFQYDENGRPFDVLPIDYFMLHYGSPALDLSSFLYISTTQRLRETHWDDLLDTYCAALATSVPPGVRIPGRTEIDAEMAATAVYGFTKALIVVPYMLRSRSDELDSLVTSDDPLDYFLALGGDMATECLADAMQHLVDMGYTDVLKQ